MDHMVNEQGLRGTRGMVPLQEMFELCPVCGGELDKRRVEKVLCGEAGTVTLHPEAMVCSRCDEVYYHESTVREFEKVRRGLRKDH